MMNELPESWTTAPLSAISTDGPQRVPGETETFTCIDIGSVDRDTRAITTPQVLLGKDAPSLKSAHLLLPKLSEALTAEQKDRKIGSLLASLRRAGRPINAGTRVQHHLVTCRKTCRNVCIGFA